MGSGGRRRRTPAEEEGESEWATKVETEAESEGGWGIKGNQSSGTLSMYPIQKITADSIQTRPAQTAGRTNLAFFHKSCSLGKQQLA